MGLDRGKQIGIKTNANGGRDCAENLFPDDGRVTCDDPANHKGDWGRHTKEEKLDEKSQKPKTP